MSDHQLRNSLIKLAHQYPKFRSDLLPLLKDAGKVPGVPDGTGPRGGTPDCPKKGDEDTAKGDAEKDSEAVEQDEGKDEGKMAADKEAAKTSPLYDFASYEDYIRDWKRAKKQFPHLVHAEKDLVPKKEWEKQKEKLMKKGSGKSAAKWIQDAIKKPGRVRKYLGIPKGKDIPLGKLDGAIKKLKGKEDKTPDETSMLQAMNLARRLKTEF